MKKFVETRPIWYILVLAEKGKYTKTEIMLWGIKIQWFLSYAGNANYTIVLILEIVEQGGYYITIIQLIT